MNFIKNLFKEEKYILITSYSQKEVIEIISNNTEESPGILSLMGWSRKKKFFGHAWDTKFKLTYNDKTRMVSIDGVYVESDSPLINASVKVAAQLKVMLLFFLGITVFATSSMLLSSNPVRSAAVYFLIIFFGLISLSMLSMVQRVKKGKQKAVEELVHILKAEVKRV